MRHRQLITAIVILVALITLGACGGGNDGATDGAPEQNGFTVKNDSMVYGLVCDGTSDSVIVLWPFKGEPVEYNCIDAKEADRIIGRLEIGDWAGVMLSREDSTEVTMAVNLDRLKGTWTYPVMPVMKELQHMSKRMQRRMMANMPDSVKETFLVPREYGFSLKRNHKAQPVGVVLRGNTLEDDSPVKYPEVMNYKQWYTYNGKLLLVSEGTVVPGRTLDSDSIVENVVDTMDIISLTADSLILSQRGIRYGFHRKENAIKANAEAMKAEARQEAMRQNK